MSEIVIIGSGFVGSTLATYFGERAEVLKVDITDLVAVEQALNITRPKVVINAAANTNTAALELPENQAAGYQVNVQGPANLAFVCDQIGAVLVHFSTLMQFSDPVTDEDAAPSPRGYYALTKAWADAQLQVVHPKSTLILRIATPISSQAHPKNLLTKLTNFSEVVSEPASLTVIDDLGPAIDALLAAGTRGVVAMVNPNPISFLEIATMLTEAKLREALPAAISGNELNARAVAAGKPEQVFLCIEPQKMARLGVALPDTREAVAQAITNYTA